MSSSDPRDRLSKRSPALQRLRELRMNKSARESSAQLAIFGKKLVSEWMSRSGKVEQIYRTKECPAWSESDYIVDRDLLEWATGVESSPKEACAAIIPLPSNQLPNEARRVLVLDGLQDPGNVGTLIRSACAFGFDAAILTSSACDPFNDKALRASMGTCLILPLWRCTLEELLTYLDKHAIHLLVAHSACEENSDDRQLLDLPAVTWLAIGSEAFGPSQELLDRGAAIRLAMQPQVESLNAAIAGSILAYQMCQSSLHQSLRSSP